MLRHTANKYINIKCTSDIASYTEKRTETSIKKNNYKIERIVGMEYQKEDKGQGSSLLLCHHYKVTQEQFAASAW